MNTDFVRERIRIKGRKIVNVFPGPCSKSVIVATVPKTVDVQFEMFTEEELGIKQEILDPVPVVRQGVHNCVDN